MIYACCFNPACGRHTKCSLHSTGILWWKHEFYLCFPCSLEFKMEPHQIKKAIKQKPTMPENLFTPNSIRTYTGKYINVLKPDPALFCIKDMAHALARTARFGGHLPFMYSVAEHSLAGMEMAPDDIKLEVLMHDTPEYILVDLPSPIKKICSEYKALEDNIAREISKKYSLQYPLPQAVKDIDMQLLQNEWDNLFIKPLPFYKRWWPFRIFWEINYPRRVEKKFIKAFYKLYNERMAQQAHAAITT